MKIQPASSTNIYPAKAEKLGFYYSVYDRDQDFRAKANCQRHNKHQNKMKTNYGGKNLSGDNFQRDSRSSGQDSSGTRLTFRESPSNPQVLDEAVQSGDNEQFQQHNYEVSNHSGSSFDQNSTFSSMGGNPPTTPPLSYPPESQNLEIGKMEFDNSTIQSAASTNSVKTSSTPLS